MPFYPIFLSVVCVLRNRSAEQRQIIEQVVATVAPLVTDYEVVVVDNGSTDDSVAELEQLTGIDGLPNLQVYALAKEVDGDTASWAGAENALGDFVVIFDPLVDSVAFIPAMLEQAVAGADVVFARNEAGSAPGLPYRVAAAAFNLVYRWFNEVDLAREAPRFRLFSRRVVNYILQHPRATLAYRHLPATAGFSRSNLSYTDSAGALPTKRLSDSIDRGIRMLTATTRAPMRVVNALCLFGAVANIVYSGYVVVVALVKTDVAPGWVSLSLQQSGMFFLLSLVLLVLGEYVLNMTNLGEDGPSYHVARELTSCQAGYRDRLNVDESQRDA